MFTSVRSSIGDTRLKRESQLRRLISAPEFGPFVLLALEIAVFTAINPDFLSVLNISNTLTFTVELGLIALAMTLLMTAGEFDHSFGEWRAPEVSVKLSPHL